MPPLGAGSSPPQTHANLITVMLQCNINAALQHPVRSHLVPAPRVAVNRRHLVWSPRSIVRIQAFAAPIGAQTPRQSIGSRAMRLHTGCRAASPLPAIRSPSDAQNIGNICYEQILGHLHLRRSDGHAHVAVRYAVLDCCRNALLGRFLPKLGPQFAAALFLARRSKRARNRAGHRRSFRIQASMRRVAPDSETAGSPRPFAFALLYVLERI